MDALLIEGPASLSGRVQVSGSKNTTLPLLFCSLLFDKEVCFRNVPRLWDVETTLKLLSSMGAEYHWDKESGRISIYPKIKHKVAPYEWVRRMRAGIMALGPLVAKYGEARVSLPGGCAIGARPVNFHLEAMEKMGVSLQVEEGYIKAQLKQRLRGAEITFPQVTVTGTENILILASVAEGKTLIENAACEPEVVAVGEFLKHLGAKIEGLGTRRIEIEGVRLQEPRVPIWVPPDRIEAATWISIAVATRSEISIENCDASQLSSVLDIYRKMGNRCDVSADCDRIRVMPALRQENIEIETLPYPGFPTDMQAQLISNLCLAEGRSRVRENIFENRFMHVAELRRLGAKIWVRGNLATVDGPADLRAAPVMATDLRASASLVVGALAAKGTTKLNRIYHLDRGYQQLDLKLQALGAKLSRLSEPI